MQLACHNLPPYFEALPVASALHAAQTSLDVGYDLGVTFTFYSFAFTRVMLSVLAV